MRKRVILVSVFAMLLSVVLACSAFAAEMPFSSMKMVEGMGDYLYEAKYQPTTDEGYVMVNEICKQLFGGSGQPLPASCSSVRKGNLYGRNFDLIFDQYANIIVRTPAGNGRYASVSLDGGMLGRVLGMASLNTLCTKSRLDDILAGKVMPEEIEEQWLMLLPYVTMDGINEKGVVCNINVAQTGPGIEATTGTNPTAEKDMYVALCPRYILDFCSSAKEAVEKLKEFNIWSSGTAESPQAEYHLMIADKENTYIVEFRKSKMLVREISDKPYMTNFNLLLDEENTVSFDMNGHVVRSTIINNDGSIGGYHGDGHGARRYDIIADGYASVNDKNSMRALLDEASYGHLYSTPKTNFDELAASDSEMLNLQKSVWALPGYSEFTFGDDMWGLTLKDATENADYLCDKYELETLFPKLAEAADRVKITPIHTVHSCVYDISAGKVWIKSQELGKEEGSWSNEYSLSLKEDSDSSSGCNAGFGALALLGVLGLFYRKKK